MDVKSGATVGFITAVGVTAGAMAGLFVGDLADVKRPGNLAAFMALAGGLTAAFIGGTIVAATPAAAGAAGPPKLLKA